MPEKENIKTYIYLYKLTYINIDINAYINTIATKLHANINI